MPDNLSISTELDNRTFVPGEQIQGRVEWDCSQNDSLPDMAEVRLFFYTAGKGSRDVEVIQTFEIDSPGPIGNRDFSFQIPENSPPSFSGKLLSLVWALEFQFGKKGDTERLEITVSPSGEELSLYKYDDGNLPDYSGMTIGKSRKRR